MDAWDPEFDPQWQARQQPAFTKGAVLLRQQLEARGISPAGFLSHKTTP